MTLPQKLFIWLLLVAGSVTLVATAHPPRFDQGLPVGAAMQRVASYAGGRLYDGARWARLQWSRYEKLLAHREAVRRRIAYNATVRRRSAPSFERMLASGHVLSHFDMRSKRIALTLDDGPTALTPRTLAILARRKVRATFFLVGRHAAQYPQFVRQIREDGHQIENHTYSHELGYPYTPTQYTRSPFDHQVDELRKTDRKLHERTRFMRAPGGLFGPCGETVSAARTEGKVIVNWDVDGDTPGWQRIANGRIVGMQPNDLLAAYIQRVVPGSIILMHPENKADAPYTLKILDRFLVDMQKKGYRFVTLDELLIPEELATR